ncbi:MAG: helix-turn-helix domain-containing protein [Deltaproteobacteria bacterium]|nr:helix-turn-helix domain-containing protein [Deltaproteobacteria bacterium]
MNERRANILWDAMLEDIRQIVREEVRAALYRGNEVNESPSAASPYLTIKQAAKASSLAPSTIRLLIRKGQLKAHRVGRRVVIKGSELEEYLESRPTKPICG